MSTKINLFKLQFSQLHYTALLNEKQCKILHENMPFPDKLKHYLGSNTSSIPSTAISVLDEDHCHWMTDSEMYKMALAVVRMN